MRNSLYALFLLFALGCAAQAQTRRPPYGLPAGARVIEERPLELGAAKKRTLVLWMLGPKKYPRGAGDEIYTCPEETRGSFYRGRTRVSLVDAASRRVVNTLRVLQEYRHGEDEFDLPYRIKAGGYYHVGGTPEGSEGSPTIMRLRDYNGDGRALEFALFDALACMGLETALFGYSERQDRVIQYALHVEAGDGRQMKRAVWHWADYLFAREPVAPGRWKYEIDYRGRGGSLDKHEIRYNPGLERFEGSVVHHVGP
jgi:hypothetical protein